MSIYKGSRKLAGNVTTSHLPCDLSPCKVSFDDSGLADECPDFTSLLNKLESNTELSSLFRYLKAGVSQLNNDLLSLKRRIDGLYPVGSIYLSVTDTNPGVYLGGTWAPWGIGRTIVGVDAGQAEFNISEKTGGSKNVDLSHSHTVNNHTHWVNDHTLTASEMPWHTHNGLNWAGDNKSVTLNNGSGGHYLNANWNTGAAGDSNIVTNGSGGNAPHNHGSTGGSAPGTNYQLSSSQPVLPPYITCYLWKRTA